MGYKTLFIEWYMTISCMALDKAVGISLCMAIDCCCSVNYPYCDGPSHSAMSFVNPWGDIFDKQNADSFVDDTSNGCNDGHLEEDMPYRESIATGQACAQLWEQILYSLGGALELKKCFWYLMYWQWVNGHPQLAPTIACPGIIALTSGNVPNSTVIPCLEVWEAQCTLGVCPALWTVTIRRRASFC
jgi:hypothetical protein